MKQQNNYHTKKLKVKKMLKKALYNEAKNRVTEDIFAEDYKTNKMLLAYLHNETDSLMFDEYFNTFLFETINECITEAYKQSYLRKYNKILIETNKKLAQIYDERYKYDTFFTDNLASEYNLTVNLLCNEYEIPLQKARQTVRIFNTFLRKINRVINELKKVIFDEEVIYDLEEYRLITYKI